MAGALAASGSLGAVNGSTRVMELASETPEVPRG